MIFFLNTYSFVKMEYKRTELHIFFLDNLLDFVFQFFFYLLFFTNYLYVFEIEFLKDNPDP